MNDKTNEPQGIVEGLRYQEHTDCSVCSTMFKDAADEIERLRTALERYGFAEHYGEPEGLSNCERNPYTVPIAESAVPEDKRDRECTCGADEQNAAVRAVLDGRE